MIPAYGAPPPYPPQNMVYPQMYPPVPPVQPLSFWDHVSVAFGATRCQHCGQLTDNLRKRKVGCVAISWMLVLLLLFFPFFWIPLCSRNCTDTKLVCKNCYNVKVVIPAECC